MTLPLANGGVAINGGSRTTKTSLRSRRCRIALFVIFLVLILLITAIVLAFTVFKIRQPRMRVLSVDLQGVSPEVTFPAIKVALNVSLDLRILVENRNHASFRHGQGRTVVLYKDSQVGEAALDPGTIPAMGSSTVGCHLTLEVDKFSSSSNLNSLIRDVMAGRVVIETDTRIPGKVSLLGFIHKHAVASSTCEIVVGFPDMKVAKQDCKQHTKL